jgi:leucyl aminopeptidase
MKINLMKSGSARGATTLVAFVSSLKKDKKEVIKINHLALNKRLAVAVEDGTISAKAQALTLFRDIDFDGFRNVLVVGLGSTVDGEAARKLGAEIKKALTSAKIFEAVIDFDGISTAKSGSSLLQAFTEGSLLASYDFSELKSKAKETTKTTAKKSADSDKKELTLHICSKLATDAGMKKAFSEGILLAECVNFSRRLGDMPGNLMTPTILANEAVMASKGTGIKATIWDKARITKEKMGGLLGVAQGSDEDPRFIILEYKGAPASKKPICFVGKGLTFDCGGISIKPSTGMEEMKYDMCGGANVLGAVIAMAKLKLKVNVFAIVPASENLVNGSATKPGDVHYARNGKSFEVNNTDAEGRLILADALCYASELKPQAIFDTATLTGAMVVALGNTHTGFFTRNSALKSKIEKAALKSGELVWNMPLTDSHVSDMKGTFADLSNMSSTKGAGSSTAAAFLEQFVEEGIPWAHFDIAGTAWAVGGRLNYCPGKGASGAIIRTFVEIAKLYA